MGGAAPSKVDNIQPCSIQSVALSSSYTEDSPFNTLRELLYQVVPHGGQDHLWTVAACLSLWMRTTVGF